MKRDKYVEKYKSLRRIAAESKAVSDYMRKNRVYEDLQEPRFAGWEVSIALYLTHVATKDELFMRIYKALDLAERSVYTRNVKHIKMIRMLGHNFHKVTSKAFVFGRWSGLYNYLEHWDHISDRTYRKLPDDLKPYFIKVGNYDYSFSPRYSSGIARHFDDNLKIKIEKRYHTMREIPNGELLSLEQQLDEKLDQERYWKQWCYNNNRWEMHDNRQRHRSYRKRWKSACNELRHINDGGHFKEERYEPIHSYGHFENKDDYFEDDNWKLVFKDRLGHNPFEIEEHVLRKMKLGSKHRVIM
jgi:hypothetical protein